MVAYRSRITGAVRWVWSISVDLIKASTSCGVAYVELSNSSASPSNDFTYNQCLPGHLREFVTCTRITFSNQRGALSPLKSRAIIFSSNRRSVLGHIRRRLHTDFAGGPTRGTEEQEHQLSVGVGISWNDCVPFYDYWPFDLAVDLCGPDQRLGIMWRCEATIHQRHPPTILLRQHLPGYLYEFVADTLRQTTVDAYGLASQALGADSQPLELLVEPLRIAPVLECGVRTAVHNASRDSRDSEREGEYNV